MSKLDANDSFIKTQPEEELYEPSDSALTFTVLSLFSLLFSIAWIIIKIPIKICILLIRFVLMMVVLRVLWLLLEDDKARVTWVHVLTTSITTYQASTDGRIKI
jgi:hypothetical protein